MTQKELFVQGEGMREIVLVRVSEDGTSQDVIDAARAQGLPAFDGESPVVTLENEDQELDLDVPLRTVGVGDRERVHVHRCKRVVVTVEYNGRSIEEDFPPSTTIRRVAKWFLGKNGFDFSGADAADLLLQLSDSGERPDEDTHVGTLVEIPACSVRFDLAPKIRVEG